MTQIPIGRKGRFTYTLISIKINHSGMVNIPPPMDPLGM